MRLFHFSEDPGIQEFVPRPVRVPAERAPGREWLNGPLVWAIDAWHQPMYLFPRECPRILIWPTPATSREDSERYWTSRERRMIAFVEERWLERIRRGVSYRYELPSESFESLADAGMWVSKGLVSPLQRETINDLAGALAEQAVELRVLPDLVRLKGLFATSLHTSGIRLRNAVGWNER